MLPNLFKDKKILLNKTRKNIDLNQGRIKEVPPSDTYGT